MSPSPRGAALVVVGLAFFTDTVLYYLLVPLLPSYAKALALGPMEVAVLFGSYAAALLVCTFPLGRLADRIGRRRPMLWGLVGLGATTLLFAFSRTFPLLVLARVLQGISASATWVTGLALLADHFPAERRGRAMGTAFACANVGVLLGPPASGWLAEHAGPRSPFVLAAALALLDAAARGLLLKDVPMETGRRLGVRELLGNRDVRVYAGAMALGSGMWALLESTMPVDLDRRLSLTPTAIGLLFAAAAATHTATSPLMGALSDRVGRRRVVTAGLVTALVLLPLPALLGSSPAIVLAMLLLGVTTSLVLSPTSPALADAVERLGSQSYASVFSILNVAFAAGMMAGPFLGGALTSLFGLKAALVVLALPFGAYAPVVWRSAEPSRTGG
jgi:multidrug resistance protein